MHHFKNSPYLLSYAQSGLSITEDNGIFENAPYQCIFDSAVCDFCVHPSAAAGLRQDFLNDRIGEILLCEQNLTDPII